MESAGLACQRLSAKRWRPVAGAEKGTRLGVWQTGLGGLRWIDELVKVGKAIDLGGNGYPYSYTAQAQHLIPEITEGPPEARAAWGRDYPHDVILPQWEGKTVVDAAAVRECAADEWLLVIAWDES